VVWDILKIVHRRFPLADILIYPVAVQGQSAGKDIARAIRVLNTRGSSDVLIVARGGGAAEDLWAFNEERVARAIYQSRIPVISAVGHEVDYTVADLVADYRAPTPSAAAEAATPNRTELVNRLRAYHTGLAQSFSRAFQQWRDQVETLNVMRLDPRAVLQRYLQRVDELEMRMSVCVARNIDRMRDAVESAGARLHALSPLAVLERGYAIVRHWPSLNVLRTVTDIRMHDRVQLQLSNGRLLCEVQEVQQ
jgi:exodeoxyribonuclease VII large subunit